MCEKEALEKDYPIRIHGAVAGLTFAVKASLTVGQQRCSNGFLGRI